MKDFLTKTLSLKLNVSERIIDTVISHQFSSAFQATTNNNTVEISGFGKFIFSQVKAGKQMKKYREQLIAYNMELATDPPEDRARNLRMRINTTLKNIDHLKPKLTNESKSNI